MEILVFAATIAVSAFGFLISREMNRTSEELKLLRQDVFRLSVDLAKLQTRLDDLIWRIFTTFDAVSWERLVKIPVNLFAGILFFVLLLH